MMKDKVLNFVAQFTEIPKEKIKLSDKLESNLGLASLDTLGFYEDFFERFNLPNPEDCHNPDVSVAHLIKVAELKVWFDPK